MLEEKSIYLVFEYAEHDFLVSHLDQDSVRELPHERFEDAERQLRSSRRVVVNDLL
jgi:hypothetical protein